LARGVPVHHDRDGRGILILGTAIDQKTLSVARDHVLIETVDERSGNAGDEERVRSTDVKRRGRRLDVDGHQPAVEREIEQLLAVVAPPPLSAAVGRDAPLRAGVGKAPHIHLGRTGLVRGVGDPRAIRGKLPLGFPGRRTQERIRRPIAIERQDPEIRIACATDLVEEETPVG